MKLLLDTNALIWWLDDNRRLGQGARRKLADPRNTILVTVVSLWEMTMKHRAGKLRQPGTAVLPLLAEQEIALLDLQIGHLQALDGMAMHHADPFDHLILAQAKAEGATLMTSDKQMTLYDIATIDTD